MKILVLSGPNLDRLGTREPAIYGGVTLSAIHARLEEVARAHGATIDARQTPHEGDLVAWIGAARDDGFAGILINPGAYTHTSIAILDALRGADLPAVEVHLSNPEAREAFRRRSFTARACVGKVSGFGARSYELGLEGLVGVITSRGASARGD
ncbi:MAG: 3-dehydroquinate dehydratase [Polyangiaceae bacterium]|nr:3-dehydroquinate dehydratase [Polyangiaceae bacterium]